MFTYAIAIAVILGCHRIWNYEDIFDGVRGRLTLWQTYLGRGGWLLTPLLCPACNAFWIGAGVAASAWSTGLLAPWLAVSLPLASYPLTRGLVWLYNQPLESLFTPARSCATPARPLAKPQTPTAVSASAEPAKPGCKTCGQKAVDLKADRAFTDSFSERVVLLTALQDFQPSYSLVSVIFDQARMLAQNPKRLVQVWVMRNARMSDVPKDLPKNVQVLGRVPPVIWKEDAVDDAAASMLQRELLMHLFNLGNATIITHDLMLVSWYTTFATAIHKMGSVRAFSWIHQIHSCVGPKPAETPATLARTTIPAGHLLAVVNSTETQPAADYYGIDTSRIVVIPNVVDPLSWGLTEHARRVLAATPLGTADFAQLYPLSLPRAGTQGKGLEHVIRTMGRLAKRGYSTALVVADAHATGADAKARKDEYRKTAADEGVEVFFISDLIPSAASYGVDAVTIRQLFSAANVFIFPSYSESAGLVAMEAKVAGNLVIVNSNVPSLNALAGSGDNDVKRWPFPALRAPTAGPPDYEALATALEAGLPLGEPHRRGAGGVVYASGMLNSALAAAKPIP